MIDINAPDFIERFEDNISNVSIGVIGHGYVGEAVEKYFREKFNVFIYDTDLKKQVDSLHDLVKESMVIFVCVPTPSSIDGACYTGIVESVLNNINNMALSIPRSRSDFVVVIKSTVEPGFTDSMQLKYPQLRLIFSPEFLTESNSINDFRFSSKVILGGKFEDAAVVFKLFEAIDEERISSGEKVIATCNTKTAELTKLFANGMLTTKVMFCNEMFQLCAAMQVNYEDVRLLACSDKRIGHSHTKVPGPDGDLGVGGKCFPKDMRNLQYMFSKLGIKEKIITAVIDRNKELRSNINWEDDIEI